MAPGDRATLLRGWRKAVQRSLGWLDAGSAPSAASGGGGGGDALEAKEVTYFDDDEELNWGEPGFKRVALRKGMAKVAAPFRRVNPVLLLAAGVAGGMLAARLGK